MTSRPARNAHWAALLLALPALWPLARPGFFVSDDGLFHVYRIAALADAWGHGVLYPRLFPGFGFGYGQAVLNFYAPLVSVLGALLAVVGVNPADAAQVVIALGFLLAALAAYGFARYLWGSAGGLLAAVAYTYFPYHLADAYVRGAIPEHFAFVWPPLILWAATATFREERPLPALLWGALAWAGLVYTHNLTALLMAPVAVVYLLLMAARTGRWRRLLPAAGSLLLAVALSAPLWLPFIVESRFVGLSLGPSDGYRNHLAPLAQAVQFSPLYQYRREPGAAADHPLGWPAVLLTSAALGLLLYHRAARRADVEAVDDAVTVKPAILVFGLLLMFGAALMITTPALPIWRGFEPALAQLQYPWRFQTLVAVGAVMAAGALPSLLPRRNALPLALVAGALLMLPSLPGVPDKPLVVPAAEAWSPDRMWREDAAAGQVGATWTGEFLPLVVSEQRWALGRARDEAQDDPVLPERPEVSLARVGYQSTEISITSSVALPVRLHQYLAPGWTATLDGRPVAVSAAGELGLVSVDVPAGSHRVAFRFGPTPARTVAAVLGALGALLWAVIALRYRGVHGTLLPMAGGVLVVLALVLGLNGIGIGQTKWTPRPVTAAVEDVALLLGYDVAPARGENALDVTLYWYALRDLGEDYKAFVHLVGADGQVAAQHDGDPVGGFTPTTRWRQGEIVPDRHRLPLPETTTARDYALKAGLYQPEPMRNLPVDPPTDDGRIDLGSLAWPLTDGGQ